MKLGKFALDVIVVIVCGFFYLMFIFYFSQDISGVSEEPFKVLARWALYFSIPHLFCSLSARVHASEKHRNPVNWFFIGLLSGPVGWLIIKSIDRLKICSSCVKRINAEATKCPYCHEIVE